MNVQWLLTYQSEEGGEERDECVVIFNIPVGGRWGGEG